MHLAICIPSRNRLEALIECIASAIRVITLSDLVHVKYSIIVRQNSDDNECYSNIQNSVELLFGAPLPPRLLHIKTNLSPTYMHENCELLVSDAVHISATHILMLPDRRLITKALFSLLSCIDTDNPDVAVFDNQSYWLSSHHILKTRDVGTDPPRSHTSYDLASDLYHCRFDGLTPRLYNCLVSVNYFAATKRYFGSYISGPCPDISFQFRAFFLSRSSVLVTSLPVIVTNARHASRTVSNTGIPNLASTDSKNITEQRGIFGLHNTIVYVGCLSHICDYVSFSSAHIFCSVSSLLSSILWEMTCPQTPALFHSRLETILLSLSDNTNPLFAKISISERKEWQTRFSSITNTPAEFQHQPLQEDLEPLTMNSFQALCVIEL